MLQSMVRSVLVLSFALALATSLAAQPPAPATADAEVSVDDAAAAPAESAPSDPAAESTERADFQDLDRKYRVRDELYNVLRYYPPELGSVLALDPTLLSDASYLANYPELVRFLDRHPEVRHNPRFYLAAYHQSGSHVLDDVFEGLAIISVFLLIALSLAWLVRTMVEQKRWSRLSKTQAEVHTRLLERFGSSEELLQYMRTPAGAKFLESAPIPVRSAGDGAPAPLSRILWSLQIGAVVAAAAIGLLFLSWRIEGDAAEGLFAMGVVALSVGVGFVASAVVSWQVSRRLGLWEGADSDQGPDDAAPRDFES